MKSCKKCGALFDTDRCIVCRKAYDVMRYAQHREREILRAAEYRRNNPEKVAAATTRWREKNPDVVKALEARRRLKHSIERNKRTAEWRANNPGYALMYRKANMSNILVYNQNYRSKKVAGGGKLSRGLSEKLFQLQRGRCACCGEPLGDNYHRDHIMPISLGGANEDWNIQLLTQRCNNQKGAKHPVEFMQSRGMLL